MPSRSAIAGTLGLIGCAALGFHYLSGPSRDASASDPRGDGSAWTTVERRFIPRLSVLLEYRRCSDQPHPPALIPRSACGNSVAPLPPSDLLQLAQRAAAAIRVAPDPAALQTAALVDLAWTSDGGNSLERSISYLRQAARAADNPASALSDLAAAHLVRAERTQNTEDLLNAIEAADEAVMADPQDPAARFNLALGLERFALSGAAGDAWRGYLAVDSVSPWAAEARIRLRSLSERARVVEQPLAVNATPAAGESPGFASPQNARVEGWEVILAEWGRAVLRGDSVMAENRLSAARGAGAALERAGGDASLHDAVRAIESAQRSPRVTLALAWAHVEYAVARGEYATFDYHAAGERVARLVVAELPTTPLTLWIRAFHGSTLVHAGRLPEAVAILAGMDGEIGHTRYPALQGSTAHSLAAALLRRGD
ncbi:MAG: hypothetical protein M3483_06510, partial [Gemmatimonadota bacterium]|nr:hypothetical protein [Gemmatimonadota bacterium]